MMLGDWEFGYLEEIWQHNAKTTMNDIVIDALSSSVPSQAIDEGLIDEFIKVAEVAKPCQCLPVPGTKRQFPHGKVRRFRRL